MIVCVDVDDTLLDTMTVACQKLHVCPSLLVSHPTKPGWYEHPEIKSDVFTSTVRHVITEGKLPPVPGAVVGLNLVAHRHEVVLCTSRPAMSQEATMQNIAAHFHPLEYKVVCCGPLKIRLQDGWGFPLAVPDVLIDDQPPLGWNTDKIINFRPPWARVGLSWEDIICRYM